MDLVGKKFCNWTVLEFSHSTKTASGTSKFWKCQCDCGRIKAIHQTTFVYGRSKKCKECSLLEQSQERAEKMQGFVVPLVKAATTTSGGFVVVGYVPKDSVEYPNKRRAKTEWHIQYHKCQCQSCGRIVIRSRHSIKEGKIRCVCHSYFNQLAAGAAARKIDFNLDRKFMWDLLKRQKYRCALTGAPIEYNTASDKTASVDRIDSSRGYENNNIQWVHKVVNIMKQDYDQDYFIELCGAVMFHTQDYMSMRKPGENIVEYHERCPPQDEHYVCSLEEVKEDRALQEEAWACGQAIKAAREGKKES